MLSFGDQGFNQRLVHFILFVCLEDCFQLKIGSDTYLGYQQIFMEFWKTYEHLNLSNFHQVFAPRDESLEIYMSTREQTRNYLQNLRNRDELLFFINEPEKVENIEIFLKAFFQKHYERFQLILQACNSRKQAVAYHRIHRNENWCFDFHTLDLFVGNKNPELLVIMDLSSRKILGWKLFLSKRHITLKSIQDTLNHATQEFGAPFYLDTDSTHWPIEKLLPKLQCWANQANIVYTMHKPGQVPSILKGYLPQHRNQTMGRLKRTLKNYFLQHAKATSFTISNTTISKQWEVLNEILSNVMIYYNEKRHSNLTIRVGIPPNQAFLDQAIIAVLKDAYAAYEKIDECQRPPVLEINYKQKNLDEVKLVIKFMLANNLTLVKLLKEADPTKPLSLEKLFLEFLNDMSPFLCEREPFPVKYFFKKYHFPSQITNWPKMRDPEFGNTYFIWIKVLKGQFSYTIHKFLFTVWEALLKFYSDRERKAIFRTAKKSHNKNLKLVQARLSASTNSTEKSAHTLNLVQSISVEQLVTRPPWQTKLEKLDQLQAESQKETFMLKAIKNYQLDQRETLRQSSMTLHEFCRLLNLLKKKAQKSWSPKVKFIKARDRVAFFLLYFFGFNVHNLLLVTLEELKYVFLYDSKQFPEQFKQNCPEYFNASARPARSVKLLASKAALKRFVFGEFNLVQDFQYVVEHIQTTYKKNKSKKDFLKLFFYVSYENPLKVISSRILLNNFKETLEFFAKNYDLDPSKFYSIDVYRINMIAQLIFYGDYQTAQHFIYYDHLRTIFSDQKKLNLRLFRKITTILAKSPPPSLIYGSKKYNILQQCEIIANKLFAEHG